MCHKKLVGCEQTAAKAPINSAGVGTSIKITPYVGSSEKSEKIIKRVEGRFAMHV
jgi:hypothetical protein